jgi:VanZ family protein
VFVAYLLWSPADEFSPFSFLNRIPYFDKITHAFLFGVLLILMFFALHPQQKSRGRRLKMLLVSGLVSLIYGILTEIVQESMHNGRKGDMWDLAADLLGIVCGIFVCLLLKKHHGRNSI